MKSIDCAAVVSIREVVEGHYLLTLHVPRRYLRALPGQFVMLRIHERSVPFLGRPFSIHRVYTRGKHTLMEILFRAAGAGTVACAQLKKGDTVVLTGPLGSGFHVPGRCTDMVLVAGGMGVAPLMFLAEHGAMRPRKRRRVIHCYFGARTASHLYRLARLKTLCTEVKVATDDGSLGYRGTVTDLFLMDLPQFNPNRTALFVCGPDMMFRSMALIMRGSNLSCQVSIEERMACGIGACLGCAVEDEHGIYKRVCKDGPVFDITELHW
ncbi:MAG: dihydroorotate dehydrogenase electron transfer subunit [Deltaproteobacteria bacterium]|nr:dihydroorotate dehydrogenase electron transfer subunit [Deltaproteobacteria bacterium]